MKLNKLAAGALALALGLGAVAPAVADTAKSGTQLIAEDYNEKLADANKFYQLRNEARAASKAAEARYEAAKAAAKKAEEAYKNAPEAEDEVEAGDVKTLRLAAEKLKGEADALAETLAKAKTEKDKKENKDNETVKKAYEKALNDFLAKNAELEKAIQNLV